MSSRNVVNVSMENVNTLRTVLLQVRKPFKAKVDPCASLAAEIEACKQQIWKCVQGRENHNTDSTSRRNPRMVDNAMTTAASKQLQPPPSQTAAVAATSPTRSGGGTGNSQHYGAMELHVSALKVVELKERLKEKGLPQNGRKKELRERLIEAMLSEMDGSGGQLDKIEETSEHSSKSPKEIEEFDVSPKKPAAIVVHPPSKVAAIGHSVVSEPMISEDVEMTEAVEPDDEIDNKVTTTDSSNHKRNQKSNPGQQTTIPAESSDDKGSQALNSRDYWMNKVKPSPVPKQKAVPTCNSASHSTSAGGHAPSPLRSVVKSAVKVLGNYEPSHHHRHNHQQASDRLDDPADDDTSPPTSEVSSSAYSKISGTKVRELVSKISSSSLQSSASKTGSGGSGGGGGGSALSKNLQAKKEARLARMAEIREKSKPVTGSKVALQPKEYTSTLSSLSATAASSTGKTKDLAAMRAQMREKAAAASKLGSTRKENIPTDGNTTNNQPSSSSSSSWMKSAPGTSNTTTGNKRAFPSSSVQNDNGMYGGGDTLGATIKQGYLKKAKVVASPKMRSPMNTYEISDREDSETDDSDESDDDSDDERRDSGKRIPSWAQKQELIRALEEQYGDSQRVDPDDLFPEVQTCDLEAIFGKNKEKKRYKNRTSSANWKDDQVSMQEKLVYKRKMGFASSSEQDTGEI